MRRDTRLSGVLHVLLHMAEQKADPSKGAEPHGTPKGAVYQLRTTGAVVY